MAKNSNATGAFKNALLAKLSGGVIEKLALRRVDLEVNRVLYVPNQPIDYAYFPESGALSVISLMGNGDSIEVGTIGREGMAGSVLLLQTDAVPYKYFVQVAGDGFRTSAQQFKEVAESSDELRNLVFQYEGLFRNQTMQGMACNGLHSVEQRCCRWLLMTRDRVDSDDMKLTHEFLALMLGVRRPSASEVLGPLQTAGLVRLQSRHDNHPGSQGLGVARL